MAILKVARMGHPVLRKKAKPVKESEIKTKEFQQFLEDMVETMHEYDGLGLASPQVHVSLRVSVVHVQEDNPRYENEKSTALHFFINPELTVLTDEVQEYWEGCLSLPGLRGLVPRPRRVKVKYLDREGKRRELEAEGFLATVLQHEFDHLDGILYVDRIRDTTKLAFEREFDRHIAGESPAQGVEG